MKKMMMIMMAITLCFTTTQTNAQELETIRSYFCEQISGPTTMNGPNQRVPERMATYVEWYSNNTIKMMDGTLWQYKGSRNGFHFYGFVRSTGIIMPGTQYVETIFAADFSRMQVNYYFGMGMPGMVIPMNSLYTFIGEGSKPAFDWLSGDF